jgi:hypothetical protein
VKRTLFAVGATVLASAFGDAHFAHAADPATASAIKHVIIIVGENRSFDHLFATYVPQKNSEKILNLLSQGIINADGTPGPNFAKAQQYKITSPPNLGQYFISANKTQKFLYATLPATIRQAACTTCNPRSPRLTRPRPAARPTTPAKRWNSSICSGGTCHTSSPSPTNTP